MRPPRSVAVIGGGVSGLATSHYLAHPEGGGPGIPEITVFEAAPRLGGKIRTVRVAGHHVDTGPDALLTRSPRVAGLLADLGLAGSLQAPGRPGSYVWTRGVLRRLPPGSVFGVPEHLLPLLRSGLLGPWGVVRAGADLVLPRLRTPADPTIAQLLRPRFGRQVYDRLIEPMLGGVHAGRADVLSARSAVPEVYALTQRHRSTYLALRRGEARGRAGSTSGSTSGAAAAGRPAASGRPPGSGAALSTLEGGLGRLVETLAGSLAGVRVLTGTPVSTITRSGDRYLVHPVSGPAVEVDAVVVTTPAGDGAELLRGVCPDAAELLAAVPYVSVATVTLVHPTSGVRRQLDGTGFLVPPVEGRLLVGCSWLSAKWPYLDDGENAVIRCMVGRYGDEGWTRSDDAELVRRVRTELDEAVGLAGESVAVHVQRWPAAMPQYTVGHETRLQALEVAMRSVPGIHLTGAAYRGVGISGCVTQAAATARRVLDGGPTHDPDRGGATPAGSHR